MILQHRRFLPSARGKTTLRLLLYFTSLQPGLHTSHLHPTPTIITTLSADWQFCLYFVLSRAFIRDLAFSVKDLHSFDPAADLQCCTGEEARKGRPHLSSRILPARRSVTFRGLSGVMMNRHHALLSGYPAYPRSQGSTFSISPHR